MFRAPLIIAIALIIAFAGGVLSALSMLNASVGFGAIEVAGWRAFPAAQMASADPYAKAHRAKGGRLLYGSAEGLQFSALRDAEGNPLNAGPELPTAKNSQTVLRRRDGSFDIVISRTAKAGNWLAIPDTGAFQLVLTLLDTPAAASTGLSGLSMPVIEQIGCGQ